MKARPTFEKRQKERARQQKKKDKTERRAERKQMKEEAPKGEEGEEDPDIAGIVPGPQPIAAEFLDDPPSDPDPDRS